MNSPEPKTPEIRKNVRTWAKEHVLPLVPLGLLVLTAAIWFNGYSSGLRQDMHNMEQRLRQDMRQDRQDMNEGFRDVHTRLDEMNGSLADVRERLSALEARFEMNPAYSEWLDRPSVARLQKRDESDLAAGPQKQDDGNVVEDDQVRRDLVARLQKWTDGNLALRLFPVLRYYAGQGRFQSCPV